MEDRRTDALISRDRCLEAIVGADLETGRALWRAAARYNERDRLERSGRLEIQHRPLPRALGELTLGESAAREGK